MEEVGDKFFNGLVNGDLKLSRYANAPKSSFFCYGSREKAKMFQTLIRELL